MFTFRDDAIGPAGCWPRPEPALVPARSVRAQLRGRRGEPGALEDATLAAEWAYRTGESPFVGPAALALAETLWLGGQHARTAAAAGRGLALAGRAGRDVEVPAAYAHMLVAR
ncbi:hypothetical protein [Actinoplanes sp. NPDC051411]|uniref:hypothetical protein n=1 Tax=Actinoplanes sp. NPDC051411 TaxID=3155522 RepID=UPI003413FEC1